MMKQGGLGGVDNFEKLLITKKEWGELSALLGLLPMSRISPHSFISCLKNHLEL